MSPGLRLYVMICVTLIAWQKSSQLACAQFEMEPEPGRLGRFEITVNTKPSTNISLEELALDPDQDKKISAPTASSTTRRFLYRIRQEGYLAFDEEQWVGKIQFKMFNRPATQSPRYTRLAELLADVNKSIGEFRVTLNDYHQYGLRLIDFCNDPKFKSVDDLEASTSALHKRYGELLKMRDSIARNLAELTGELGCKEVAEDYKKKLKELEDSLDKILSKSQTFTETYEKLKQ